MAVLQRRTAMTPVHKSSIKWSSNQAKYGISAAALAVFLTTPAFAQVAPQAAPESVRAAAATQETPSSEAGPQETPPGNTTTVARVGDRIVVTARRVEEDLQEVPI